MKNREIYAVDIDQTIADGIFWKEECTPRLEAIEKINELYKKGNVVIYHTGRNPKYYELTYAWLIKHGCYFHALRMGKMSADHYIDDKNISLEEL